jgi:hypothetical protein
MLFVLDERIPPNGYYGYFSPWHGPGLRFLFEGSRAQLEIDKLHKTRFSDETGVDPFKLRPQVFIYRLGIFLFKV